MYSNNVPPTVVPVYQPPPPPVVQEVPPPAPPVTTLLVTETVPASANGTAASLGVIGGNFHAHFHKVSLLLVNSRLLMGMKVKPLSPLTEYRGLDCGSIFWAALSLVSSHGTAAPGMQLIWRANFYLYTSKHCLRGDLIFLGIQIAGELSLAPLLLACLQSSFLSLRRL